MRAPHGTTSWAAVTTQSLADSVALARSSAAFAALRILEYARSTLPLSSISLTSGPKRSGSSRAAWTTALAFSYVRAFMPTALATFALVRPAFTWRKLREVFLGLPGAVPPCPRCRSLAALLSMASTAAPAATASDGVKSLRQVFSSRCASAVRRTVTHSEPTGAETQTAVGGRSKRKNEGRRR